MGRQRHRGELPGARFDGAAARRIVCHREGHIETREGGAPGFYTHGAKLMLADGDGAKLTPAAIESGIVPIKPGVHWVQPHAVSITQATERGPGL